MLAASRKERASLGGHTNDVTRLREPYWAEIPTDVRDVIKSTKRRKRVYSDRGAWELVEMGDDDPTTEGQPVDIKPGQ